MDTLNLPERIRTARKAKNLSQFALALAVNVHERTVVAWEAGEHVPDDDNWKQLCRELPELDTERNNPLATVSLEDLIFEIDRRGFDVSLNPKKTR